MSSSGVPPSSTLGSSFSGQDPNFGKEEDQPPSKNSKDGFEAQVQIQIGPYGSTTISATRRRNPDALAQRQTGDLIVAQSARKEKLESELATGKSHLAALRQELALLRSKLDANSKLHPLLDLEKLKDDNHRLRVECDLMTRQVDLYENGSVPLGETSEEYYGEIEDVQARLPFSGNFNNNNLVYYGEGNENEIYRRARVMSEGVLSLGGIRQQHHRPPPRPPPPRFLNLQDPSYQQRPPFSQLQLQQPWECSMCTFRDHPQLSECEQCGMLKLKGSPLPQNQTGAGPSRNWNTP